MADWCLVESEAEVAYSEVDSIVRWRNCPYFVILNVPDDLLLTEAELVVFINRDDVEEFLLRRSISEDMRQSPPKYALIKLGDGMPDNEMKGHFHEEHYSTSHMKVYDWQQDNRTKDPKKPIPWYDPKMRFAFEFYKKYDIVPPRGWAFFESQVEYNESFKGTP